VNNENKKESDNQKQPPGTQSLTEALEWLRMGIDEFINQNQEKDK
jgi:hypothetical protein